MYPMFVSAGVTHVLTPLPSNDVAKLNLRVDAREKSSYQRCSAASHMPYACLSEDVSQVRGWPLLVNSSAR